MALPVLGDDIIQAYSEMSARGKENDFMVCKFTDGMTMGVVATGTGGMNAMKEALKEQCDDDLGVGIFRVTAVDDRGVTVSYRTKLIHVIYIGPNTKALKRAKVTGYNSVLKAPFIGINQYIQTDDIDGDVTEESIEKMLRASGGAHQPTSFDFTNA